MTRELVRQEGLFVGGSSGAAVAGAIKYAEASEAQGEHPGAAARRRAKYLSKIFDDKWMRENGFLDEPDPLGTVAELLRHKKQRAAHHRQEGRVGARRDRAPCATAASRRCRCWRATAGASAASSPRSICSNYLVKGEGGLDAPIDALVESDYATVTPATRDPPAAQHLQRRARWWSSRRRRHRRRHHQDRPHRVPGRAPRGDMKRRRRGEARSRRRASRRSAIHAGQSPEPIDRRGHDAGLPDLDLRAEGPGRAHRLRVLAHAEPDPLRAGGQPGRARGRRAGAWPSTPACAASTAVLATARRGRPRRGRRRPLRRHASACSTRSSGGWA